MVSSFPTKWARKSSEISRVVVTPLILGLVYYHTKNSVLLLAIYGGPEHFMKITSRGPTLYVMKFCVFVWVCHGFFWIIV